MREAFCLSLPNETISARAESRARLRPRRLGNEALVAVHAQKNAAKTAAKRRAEHLIDEDPALIVGMLQREQAAVGQNADCKSTAVGDAMKAKIAFEWGMERSDVSHWRAPQPEPKFFCVQPECIERAYAWSGAPANRPKGLTAQELRHSRRSILIVIPRYARAEASTKPRDVKPWPISGQLMKSRHNKPVR